MTLTHLITIVFLYQSYHPEDGRITGRNMLVKILQEKHIIIRLTPNDHYSGRTAPLISKRCILYIYSTNIGAEYL